MVMLDNPNETTKMEQLLSNFWKSVHCMWNPEFYQPQ